MRDNAISRSGDAELEAALERVERARGGFKEKAEKPSRTRSVEDIDRLIAEIEGREYVPEPEKTPSTPAEDFERILNREFAPEAFAAGPVSSEVPEESETTDISSSSRESEVEGQRRFSGFDADGFDGSSFEIETVVVPEDKPEPPSPRFARREAEAEKDNKDEGPDKREEDNKETAKPDYKARFFAKMKFDGFEGKPLAPEDAEKKTEDVAGDVEGQITLAGFEERREAPTEKRSADEDVEKAALEERRRRTANFKLSENLDLDSDFSGEFEAAPDKTAKEKRAERKKRKKLALEAELNRPLENDYSSPEQRTSFHARLRGENRKASRELTAAAVIEAVAIILNLIPLAVAKFSIESSFFAPGSRASSIANAVLLIIAATINNEKFIDGLTAIFKRGITSDSAISLTAVAALVQNTFAATAGGSGSGTAVFSLAAITAILIGKIADKLDAQRILGNFEVCAYRYERNMRAIKEFENESEIAELGEGLKLGKSSLLYSAKLAFPSDFLKNSRSDLSRRKLARPLVYAASAAAAAVGVAAGIKNGSFAAALSAFAGTFCVCSPVFSSFAPALILRIANAGLNPEGTAIISAEAAEKISSANAVVMDSADVFDRSRCKMHGMRDFKNMRIDDVLLYAAAMIVKSGSPLKDSFELAVEGGGEPAPSVREITYEEKLGMTANVRGRKVLLGDRNLLVVKGAEVPPKAEEEKYLRNGKKTIYLAADGKIAAVFVVSYAPDEKLTGYFKKLEKNGIQTLVRANDPNVTRELLAESFGLPRENFKILSMSAGKLFRRRRDALCDRRPAEAIHDGTAYSELKAIAACRSIVLTSKFLDALQIVISALGFILCAALGLSSLGAFVNGLAATAFLGAGLALCAAAASSIASGTK